MKFITVCATLAPFVAGHGMITSPQARLPGPALAAACGQQIFNGQSSDPFGNIQQELQNIQQADFDAAACNLFLCKGYQFDDNTANVQSFAVGQVVPIEFDIRAPHTGFANVSIVDTATNTIIGEPLKEFAVFASNSEPITDDQKAFTVTIPDLAGKCTVAGECVIQHFWDSPEVQQTYESCIDFTVGGANATARRKRAANKARISPKRYSVPRMQ